MISIEENIREIEKATAGVNLATKIVILVNDLSEKGDKRTNEIIEAYFSITKTEEGFSRVPWRVLEYFETNHLDLYRRIQTMALD